MARLFVAIDVSAEARDALAALVAPGELAGKWISPGQLHLTLRFLGHVPAEQVVDLGAALARVTASRFDLGLQGVGVFPPARSRKPARVLWAGVAPLAPVRALKDAIDAALLPLCGPDEETAARGFSPHVTLARLADNPRRTVTDYLERHRDFAHPPFPVTELLLMESRPGASGSEYHPLVRRSFQ